MFQKCFGTGLQPPKIAIKGKNSPKGPKKSATETPNVAKLKKGHGCTSKTKNDCLHIGPKKFLNRTRTPKIALKGPKSASKGPNCD